MFHPDSPDDCPPNDAVPANREVFRKIDDLPIRADHFLSHNEVGNVADLASCLHWGCSVWVSEEDVHHARKIIPPFRRKHIIRGDVTPEDGRIKHTPGTKQPNHHTFWKVFGRDISGSFQVFLEPEVA